MGIPAGSLVRPWETGPYVPAPWRAASALPSLPATTVVTATVPTPALTVAAVPSLAPTPVMPMAAIRTPDAVMPAMTEDALSRDARDSADTLPPIAAFLVDPSTIERTFSDDALGAVAASDSISAEELPWIDHFLATTPLAPMEAIAGPPDVYRYATPAASQAIVDPVGLEIPEVSVQGGVDAEAGAADPTSDLVPTLASEMVPDDAEHILQAFAHDDGPESEPAIAAVPVDVSTDLASEFADDFAAVFGDDGHDDGVNGSMPGTLPTAAVEPYRTPFATAAITPYTPTASVPTPVQPTTALPTPSAPLFAAASQVPPYVPPVGTPQPSVTPFDASAVESWPLAEAADALDEITRELGEVDGANDASPARLFGSLGAPSPLPAWSDEDLMDIMPMRHATPTVASADAAPLVSGEAHDPSALAADASAQAAAQALETLAQRVRAGELQLPGYDPRMGDAAALVSALAALLGLRLG